VPTGQSNPFETYFRFVLLNSSVGRDNNSLIFILLSLSLSICLCLPLSGWLHLLRAPGNKRRKGGCRRGRDCRHGPHGPAHYYPAVFMRLTMNPPHFDGWQTDTTHPTARHANAHSNLMNGQRAPPTGAIYRRKWKAISND